MLKIIYDIDSSIHQLSVNKISIIFTAQGTSKESKFICLLLTSRYLKNSLDKKIIFGFSNP